MAAQALIALPWCGARWRTSSAARCCSRVSVAVGSVRAFQMPTQQALDADGAARRAAAARPGLQLGRHAERHRRRPGDRRLRLRRRRRRSSTRSACVLFVIAGALVGRRSLRASRRSVKKAISLETAARRGSLRRRKAGRSRRHLARSLRGAARRRDGAAADLRARRSARRLAGASACCAPRPAAGAFAMSIVLTRWPCRAAPGASCSRRSPSTASPPSSSASRPRSCCRWSRWSSSARADMISVRHPPVAGAARHARRDARPRQRRQLGLHRRLEPARRIRVGRRRRPGCGPVGLGGLGGGRHGDDAATGGWVLDMRLSFTG